MLGGSAPASNEFLRSLVDESSGLSVSRQCELLRLSRSTYYYTPEPPASGFTDEEERAMAIIEGAYLENPCYGARKYARFVSDAGLEGFGRKRCARLMEVMGIRSLAPKPDLSKPAKQHPRFPYLLRGKPVRHPNQVWSTDITYVKLGRGHVYLSVVIDWFSRYVVAWRLHDTLEAEECVACMDSAVRRFGVPAIANSDQGSTYTSEAYAGYLASKGIAQSMDGKGRWADNVFVERWFRTFKHEYLYLAEYSDMRELRALVARSVQAYNERRPHASLGYDTPASWYFSGLNSPAVATPMAA